jgi:basic membrane protein A
MQSVSDGNWNLVITAFGQQKENLTQTAPQHANQKYVYFDDEVKGANIWNIKFRQNEGSFLAGVLAALATSDPKSFPLSKGNKRVAVLGGQDLPVIRDFIVGFEDGVKAVDPSIAVDVAFAGSFADPNKGYSVATALYDKGADVIFPVAGGTGVGTLKASRDAKRYSIGVDADQNGLYPGHVLASMVKRTDVAVYDAIKKAKDGSAPYGTLSYYGLQNHGVDLILDDALVPASAKKRLDQATQDVVSGKVTVRSALN